MTTEQQKSTRVKSEQATSLTTNNEINRKPSSNQKDEEKGETREPEKQKKRSVGRPRGLKTSLHRIPIRVFEHPAVREAMLASWMEALQQKDTYSWEGEFAKIIKRYPPRANSDKNQEFLELVENLRAILRKMR